MGLRDDNSDDGYHWECPVNQVWIKTPSNLNTLNVLLVTKFANDISATYFIQHATYFISFV